MESEDASDEEAPPHNPKKKNFRKREQLEAISMLVMMATEDHLQRGAIMDIAKRFNVACSPIYRAWECTLSTHVTGVISSLDFVSQKKIWESP